MRPLIRNSFLIGAAAIFAACGGGSGDANASESANENSSSAIDGRTAYENADDHAIGSADAPVTVIEYASVSCGACANWHQTVYPEFKEKYIDTGKVRYVFREFLAGEPNMADAGFMIANCASEDNFFKNIKLQFDRQAQLFEFAKRGELRSAYVNLAKSSGLSEEEFFTCMANQDVREGYRDRMQLGLDAGVSGTPAFEINGQLTPRGTFTLESMEEIMLPLLGEEPAPADEADAEGAE